ncbi:MAG: DNA translocase FtsK [Chloroflexi bacterium]|nr:DNA translocase FtsK [Chloroflexota bacterium]
MGSRAKPKQSSPKSPRGAGKGWVRVSLSWQFWVLALLALVVIVLVIGQDIAKAVFQTFGIGLVVVLPWLGILVWAIRGRRLRSALPRWNLWLGALVLSLALLGFMALFRPHISIAGADLHDRTLAGALGHAIAGSSFEWVRLLALIFIGGVLLAPQPSREIAKSLYYWSKGRARPQTVSLGQRFSDWFHGLGARIGALFGRKGAAGDAGEIAQAEARKPSRKKKEEEVTAEPAEEEMPPVEDVVLPADSKRALPPIELLKQSSKATFAQANNEERAKIIEEALGSYGVEVKVREINPGPSVTQFGVEPGWARKYKKVFEKDQSGKPLLDKEGNPKFHMEEVSKTRVKVDRIATLANDLALALAVSDIRIETPVPGKALVGIEVPNVSTAIVSMRSVLESQVYQKAANKSRLVVALGQGAGGEPAVGDLSKMPHVLIAGATGSGKTVCLNCFVTCLLCQATPQEVRFVLIDPKRVEMVAYNEVPHLLTPVVVDMDKAVETLRRVTQEMDNRYRKFAAAGARNIESYNRNPKVTERMPYIVVIIDELADLMMTTPDVVEPLLCRLAQLARATGIHLVVATQRPSVDVITGLIKANFPTRISFAVVSSVDSIGAEKLLGKGDMLYIPPEASKPKRIRGCFVSDEEIDRLVKYWKNWALKNFPPQSDRVAQDFADLSVAAVDADPLLAKARQLADEVDHLSASLLQRRLHIGYQRAARLMEQLEEEGLLDEQEFGGPGEGTL